MALRINTNVAALNAHRNLTNTDNAVSKSMERLSSGYRINRAADDAAGLSIANRLRTNTRSLTVASRNVTEAKSMITTAEGAANQVEGILERMKELATQSASDNAATDRSKIQAEFSSLKSEIDRIVNDTEYQGTSLLKGTFGNGVSTHTAALADGVTTNGSIVVTGAAAGVYTLAESGTNIGISGNGITQTISGVTPSTAQTLNFDKLGITLDLNSLHTSGALTGDTITVTAGACGGLFQVGSSNDVAADRIGVNLGDLQSSTLLGSSTSMSTRADASTALKTIDDAIDKVNVVLGDMGASINRLDYTSSNLKVSIENFSASESVIRDVDMASEMVSFTKNQILMQAGTAMLAQANSASQNVLTLLR